MLKTIIITCVLCVASFFANAQENEWKEYFGNGTISIQFLYTECHKPEKGIHHENVLLRLFNNTSQDVTVSYYLQRIYNGKEVKADASDFTFTVPAYTKIESSCDDLKEGLYVFSRILDLKANSVLNSFELKKLAINGEIIAR